jgi:hypothetical protein
MAQTLSCRSLEAEGRIRSRAGLREVESVVRVTGLHERLTSQKSAVIQEQNYKVKGVRALWDATPYRFANISLNRLLDLLETSHRGNTCFSRYCSVHLWLQKLPKQLILCMSLTLSWYFGTSEDVRRSQSLMDISVGFASVGAAGWSTALKVGRSQVRFPRRSLGSFMDLIITAALWTQGPLPQISAGG